MNEIVSKAIEDFVAKKEAFLTGFALGKGISIDHLMKNSRFLVDRSSAMKEVFYYRSSKIGKWKKIQCFSLEIAAEDQSVGVSYAKLS